MPCAFEGEVQVGPAVSGANSTEYPQASCAQARVHGYHELSLLLLW